MGSDVSPSPILPSLRLYGLIYILLCVSELHSCNTLGSKKWGAGMIRNEIVFDSKVLNAEKADKK